jgi:hypothetical protein
LIVCPASAAPPERKRRVAGTAATRRVKLKDENMILFLESSWLKSFEDWSLAKMGEVSIRVARNVCFRGKSGTDTGHAGYRF